MEVARQLGAQTPNFSGKNRGAARRRATRRALVEAGLVPVEGVFASVADRR
jgi:hypothetical protein